MYKKIHIYKRWWTILQTEEINFLFINIYIYPVFSLLNVLEAQRDNESMNYIAMQISTAPSISFC